MTSNTIAAALFCAQQRHIDFCHFQYIGALNDYLPGIGIRRFVELEFMPAPIAGGDKTIS